MANIIEIKDFSAPELDLYARLNENQLLRYYEPQTGLFIAESPNVIMRALQAGYEPVSFLLEKSTLRRRRKICSQNARMFRHMSQNSMS